MLVKPTEHPNSADDRAKTVEPQPATKKAYRPPGFSVYGRIERTTGGGSGMAKESFAMETFRFP